MLARGILAFTLVLVFCFTFHGAIFADEEPLNLLKNPSFEEGTASWTVNNNGGTVASYVADDKDSIDGDQSVLAIVGDVGGWGSNFYQGSLPGGKVGDVYTFSVMAKSEGGPVSFTLSIERGGDPWDKVIGENVTFDEEWTEVYVTFVVGLDFPEGWTAYINSSQPNVEFRVDLFRLYEGEYVPFEAGDVEASVSASAKNLIATWGRIRRAE